MVSRVAKATTPTLAVGSLEPSIFNVKLASRQLGFTLLELLVVLAIVAMASVGVGLAMRDGTQVRLEREALRLSALLESARVRSQASGVPLRWRASAQGFRFEGGGNGADEPLYPWLDADTRASIALPAAARRPGEPQELTEVKTLLLGPEPIIGAQALTLASLSAPQQQVRIATDGVRPFAVQDAPQ